MLPPGMKPVSLGICDISGLQFFPQIMLQADAISVQNSDPSCLQKDKAVV